VTRASDHRSTALAEEDVLLDALRRGDEAAFTQLVHRLEHPMIGLARLYTSDQALIEDAVQDTWMAVLRGLPRFEQRSSFRTWVLRILLYRLKTRLRKDGRLIPCSHLFDAATAPAEPALGADRFLPADHPRWPFHWKLPPQPWAASPEERLLSSETLDFVRDAITALPPAQREVIVLRDVLGISSDETCQLLDITPANQRVLLHRARARVRAALDSHITGS
jgi:RNA polymerase sigma-70 factor (ECF subfamily)